jgi:hypothetical protein
MAWTVTRYPSVFGNKAVVGLKLTADAATQTIETGLKNIEWFTAGTYASMASQTGRFVYINSNASGVQSVGVIGCSGFAVGDDIYITVFGTR